MHAGKNKTAMGLILPLQACLLQVWTFSSSFLFTKSVTQLNVNQPPLMQENQFCLAPQENSLKHFAIPESCKYWRRSREANRSVCKSLTQFESPNCIKHSSRVFSDNSQSGDSREREEFQPLFRLTFQKMCAEPLICSHVFSPTKKKIHIGLSNKLQSCLSLWQVENKGLNGTFSHDC